MRFDTFKLLLASIFSVSKWQSGTWNCRHSQLYSTSEASRRGFAKPQGMIGQTASAGLPQSTVLVFVGVCSSGRLRRI